MIPRAPLKTFSRFWWVCPECGTENDVAQRPCPEGDVREALGIEPWSGDPVPEAMTLASRGRCHKCELIVDIYAEDVAGGSP